MTVLSGLHHCVLFALSVTYAMKMQFQTQYWLLMCTVASLNPVSISLCVTANTLVIAPLPRNQASFFLSMRKLVYTRFVGIL